ncbi:hypothetical protein AV530_005035 [Patagioenas fasciata monilis]|uniref:Uncharacterized protein n=1 Tax=Patagioenas fasciata monilis TaxID=372326 RepID=A0A1V4K3Y4_PATFA|nr:hypothetical protein AV530_005035 [Patagioenas fasciata monilis]
MNIEIVTDTYFEELDIMSTLRVWSEARMAIPVQVSDLFQNFFSCEFPDFEINVPLKSCSALDFVALDRPLRCLHSFLWFDSPVKDKTRDQVNGGFQQRRCRSMGHSCCGNCVPNLCPSDLYNCPGQAEAAAPHVAFAVFGVPGLKI